MAFGALRWHRSNILTELSSHNWIILNLATRARHSPILIPPLTTFWQPNSIQSTLCLKNINPPTVYSQMKNKHCARYKFYVEETELGDTSSHSNSAQHQTYLVINFWDGLVGGLSVCTKGGENWVLYAHKIERKPNYTHWLWVLRTVRVRSVPVEYIHTLFSSQFQVIRGHLLKTRLLYVGNEVKNTTHEKRWVQDE